ncbi:MAG TPA: YlmH/Sll1252 family protein [Pseudogracilibacillus sp.]|nr:YlmH/Sll1252 family protein [Pseudogracilibacillus sp.]
MMGIYQHFRKHEHPFVDLVLSWKSRVEEMYQRVTTDFLDPREQEIAKTILGKQSDLYYYDFAGGSPNAERKRLIIAPFYEEIKADDFDLVLLESEYASKFVSLSHRHVLGTLMSLGIDRKKTGDIYVLDDTFYLFLTGDMVDFVSLHLTKIKNSSVALKQVDWHEGIESNDEWIKKDYILSSLRLDVFIKEVYQLSRNKAADFIKNDFVKVNHTNVIDPAIQLMEDDLISVRKYGRSKFLHTGNRTRKDNIVVTAAKLKTK